MYMPEGHRLESVISRGEERRSIQDRVEIECPDTYVPVYHETKHTDEINQYGLQFDIEKPHQSPLESGRTLTKYQLEKIFQSMRPDHIKKLGIDRMQSSYAYPNMRKKSYFGSREGNQILELRVDPETSYVGDMDEFGSAQAISYDEKLGHSFISRYWAGIITLKDFNQWYEEVDDGDDRAYFRKKKGAPEEFPSSYSMPEVLITKDIPQEHIKLVKQEE